MAYFRDSRCNDCNMEAGGTRQDISSTASDTSGGSSNPSRNSCGTCGLQKTLRNVPFLSLCLYLSRQIDRLLLCP